MLPPGCLKHHRCHRLANGTDGPSEKGRMGSLLRSSALIALRSPGQIMKQLICCEPDAFNRGHRFFRSTTTVWASDLCSESGRPSRSLPASRCATVSYFSTSVLPAPLHVANES